MTDENSKTAIQKSPFKWAIGAALMVWAVWLVNLAVLHNSAADLRGTFGDMFGASNAIFSGLALVGLIYAIIQQQEQLELAREELSTARSDLRETKKLSEEQSSHIDEQNRLSRKRDFEVTFFSLVSFNREAFESKFTDKVLEGILSQFRQTLFESNPEDGKVDGRGGRVIRTIRTHERKPETIAILFARYFENRSDDLSAWDQSIWVALEFVEDSEFSEVEKAFYIRVFMSRLHPIEAVYISLSATANEKLKSIVRKYRMFSSKCSDESLEYLMHQELKDLQV